MRKQREKEVYHMEINKTIKLLREVEKSNLSTFSKMSIALHFGFLDGINEIEYIDEEGNFK